MQTASVTEKHRSVLINFFYYALILGAAYLFLRFAFWPLFPFLLAFFVAMLLQSAETWQGRIVRSVSLACGMASNRDASGIDEIVKKADVRMYEAKRKHYASLGGK